MDVAQKFRNVWRGLRQKYASADTKRSMWNAEFAGGRWECLDHTPGDCIYEFVERYARKGSILDLGCGAGNTAAELNPASYQHYTGVDISDVAVAKAAERTGRNGRYTFTQSDVAAYIPRQSHDVILFRESIYYVPVHKITPMLKRLSKYLTHEGVFIVRMYNEGSGVALLLAMIARHFEVLEKYVSERPKAVVVVFR